MSVGPDREAPTATPTVDRVLAGWTDAPEANAPSSPEHGAQPGTARLLTNAELLRAQAAQAQAAQGTPAMAKLVAIPPRVWVPVLLLMALLLCVSAAYDVVTIYTPGSWSNARWRFAIIGSAAPKMLKVTVAVTLVMLALIFSERRILSNIFAGILALTSLGVIAIVPLMLMDSLQMRLVLPTRMAGDVFVANVSFVIGLLVLMSLVLIACALTLRKTANWLKLDLNSPGNVANREWDR